MIRVLIKIFLIIFYSKKKLKNWNLLLKYFTLELPLLGEPFINNYDYKLRSIK